MTDPRLWDALSQQLRLSPAYRALRQRLGESVRLPIPAAAWVGELLREDLGRRLLVVVPHESDALAWAEAARLFGASRRVLYFPAPSLTPYQEVDLSLQVRAQEAVALDRILAGEAATVVCTPRALYRKLPPAEMFLGAVVEVRTGEKHPVEGLAERLAAGGYRRVDMVGEVGDFAVRGGVFDVFPPGEAEPLRFDLFGDTVESIRRFDPLTQRSAERAETARLLPLGIFPAGAREAERLADTIQRLAGEEAAVEAAELAERLRRQGGFPGWENYLPLLVREAEGLEDALSGAGGRALVVAVDRAALSAEIAHHGERLAADYEARREHGRLALQPEAFEHPVPEVERAVEEAEWWIGDVLGDSAAAAAGAVDFEGSTTDLFHGQLPRFPREVETARARGERLVLVAPGETLRAPARAPRRAARWRSDAAASSSWRASSSAASACRRRASWSTASASSCRAGGARWRAARAVRYGPFVSGLRDLKVGDYVVHADHGIGQFIGAAHRRRRRRRARRPAAGRCAPPRRRRPVATPR